MINPMNSEKNKKEKKKKSMIIINTISDTEKYVQSSNVALWLNTKVLIFLLV